MHMKYFEISSLNSYRHARLHHNVPPGAILILSNYEFTVYQCFSTFVRPRTGKFFFRKTRARFQQIYSSVSFHFFLSSYIKLT